MSSTTKQQADKIVKYLEVVKMHPRMYIAEDIPPISNFLYGFVAACESFGINLYQQYEDIFRKVEEERGWKFASYALWDQMRDAGLSDDEITQEILAVHIEVWRRVGERFSPSQ